MIADNNGLIDPGRTQDASRRALQKIMLRIVPETAQWHARPDRLGLGRDQWVDAALLESAVDLVPSIGCDRPDGDPSGGFDFVHLRLVHLAFVRLSGCNLDIENNADFVIDGGVLLVSGFQPSVASVRGHCRIGIGRADLLVLATLPPFFSSSIFRSRSAHPRHDALQGCPSSRWRGSAMRRCARLQLWRFSRSGRPSRCA